jgi:hypothetical protein
VLVEEAALSNANVTGTRNNNDANLTTDDFVPPTKYSGTSISQTSRETKKIRFIENSSYRNTFFLLIFQLNLHQACVLLQEKHSSICNK